MSDLPPGWNWASVGSVAESLVDGPFGSNLKSEHYQSNGVRVIRLQNIADGRFNDTDKAYISEEHAKSLSRHDARPGDVLIAAMGDVLPRVCLVPRDAGRAIVKADCFRLRPRKDVLPQYLAYMLSAPQTRKQASSQIAGVGRPRLNLKKVSALTIPMRTENDQGQVVAAIEEQFSRLDVGLAGLGRAKRNLSRIQQAHLHRIVGFGLGAQLPSGWRWATVGEVAGSAPVPVLTGPFGTALSRSDFQLEGIPVLTIGCLTPDGIKIDRAPRVSFAKGDALSRYFLETGDVLFSRMATVGRAAVIGKAEAGSLINYHLMRLRLDRETILPDFLVLLCRGSRAIQRYLSDTNHGVTRPGINTKQLLNLPVALPSIGEQGRLVDEVRFWDDIILHLEKEIAQAEARAGRLRSSILAAAFSGELI